LQLRPSLESLETCQRRASLKMLSCRSTGTTLCLCGLSSPCLICIAPHYSRIGFIQTDTQSLVSSRACVVLMTTTWQWNSEILRRSSWRWEVAGEPILAFLKGKVSVSYDPTTELPKFTNLAAWTTV
jgi:hypothetical protein